MNLNYNTCWISPNGEIIPVRIHHHGEFANKVLGTNLDFNSASQALVRQGWLHIGFSEWISFTPYAKLSEVQAKTLLEVMDKVTSGTVHQNILSYICS